MSPVAVASPAVTYKELCEQLSRDLHMSELRWKLTEKELEQALAHNAELLSVLGDARSYLTTAAMLATGFDHRRNKLIDAIDAALSKEQMP